MADNLSSIMETKATDRSARLVDRPALRCQAVLIALGLLLLAAAGLKTYQAMSEPRVSNSITILALIYFETCFGAWLVVGARTNGTWRATVALFATFASVSGYKALSGASSCGCLGTIQVNPWISLEVDVVALFFLFLWRTGVKTVTPSMRSRVFRRVAFVALPLSLLTTAASIYGSSRFVSLDGDEPDIGALVVLEPESWIGARWPLLKESGLKDHLQTGDWIVLLFRHDCHTCHNVMLELEHLLSASSTQHKIALVGIDQKSDDIQVARLRELGCLLGHLPQDRQWFVRTPLRLHLHDGACTSADAIEHWQ
jgi:hypothetical protein